MSETVESGTALDTLAEGWMSELSEEEGSGAEDPQAAAPQADTQEVAEPEAEEGEEEASAEAAEPDEVSASEEESEDEADESEEVAAEEDEELGNDDVIFTVRDGDKEVPVTLEEAQKGYMRQAEWTRKTQSLSQERQQVEAHRSFIENELAPVLGRLQSVIPVLEQRVNSATSERELQQLLEEGDTAQYIQRKEQMEAERQQLEALRQQQAQAEEMQRQARIPGERAALLEKIPEWQDPERMKADWPKLLSFAGDVADITPEEWRDVGYDHRFVTVLEYARRYYETTRRAPVVNKKLRKLPKVARPSAPRSTEGKQEQAKKAAFQRLKKRGGVGDLAETFLLDGTV